MGIFCLTPDLGGDCRMDHMSHMDMALWSGGWSPESPLTLPIIGWTSTSFGTFLVVLLAVFVFGLLSEAAGELVAADGERLRRIKENHRHRLLAQEEEEEIHGAGTEGINEKLSFPNRLRACGLYML